MPPKNGALALTDVERKFRADSSMMFSVLGTETKNFCRGCFVFLPMSLVFSLWRNSFVENFSPPLIRSAHLLGWVYLS